MASVQGLSVPQHGFLEALLDTDTREKHGGKIKHAVGGPCVGTLVEVLVGELHIPLLLVRTVEINVPGVVEEEALLEY